MAEPPARCPRSPGTAALPLRRRRADAYLRPRTNVPPDDMTNGDRHMRGTRRSGVAILISLAILLPAAAAPVSALTLQRTWSARLNLSSGAISLRAYTSGAGSIRYSL